MGCFNLTGGFTNLPIYYRNRCVCFICMVDTKMKYCQTLDICSRNSDFISPICPPLRGEYSDYGSIENIDRDAVCLMLEDIFGCEIDKIISGIKEGYRNKVCYSIMEQLDIEDTHQLILVIDHESAYENVLEKHVYFDFKKSYEISKDNRNFFDGNDDPSAKKYGEDGYFELFNSGEISFKRVSGKTMNMNPEVELGIFEKYREPYPRNFLYLFKKYPDYIWSDGMEKPVVDMVRFWWGLYDMELHFDMSRYGRQFRRDKDQLNFLEHCVEILKKIETNDEY